MPLPRYHAAVSLGIAALVVRRTHRWRDALPILVAGVLVDIDHLVDLAVNRRTDEPARYLILPLHAWEWVFGLVLRGTRVSLGLAGGLSAHLALDQFNDAIRHPFFYWISLRAAYGFRARYPLIYPEKFKRSSAWMRQSPLDWL
jgi:hypothetical protein